MWIAIMQGWIGFGLKATARSTELMLSTPFRWKINCFLPAHHDHDHDPKTKDTFGWGEMKNRERKIWYKMVIFLLSLGEKIRETENKEENNFSGLIFFLSSQFERKMGRKRC